MHIEKDTKLWSKIHWSHISRSLRELFYHIKEKGNAELYLVGGCVRDMLLGKEPKDYDLCTNLKPEEIKELLKDVPFECDESTAMSYAMEGEHCPDSKYTFIDTGLKHGTITIHDNEYDMFYEITTYRVDGKYTDGRHPDEITFTPSLEEDLKRRDFTINSFAYDLISDELVMLDGYYKTDLELGIIRTVGDPVDRFNEDALRMLRAIRFAAQLNFSISKNVYDGLCECAPLIANISKERIRDELTKILLSDNPQMLEFISTTRLEDYMFNFEHPYISDMINCDHQNPWHYTDVFHHTMDVVKKLPKDFNLRWAALLHDVGKPYVKKLKPGTTDHYRYIGHPEKSAEIADLIMEELKFSNEQKEIIHNFVLYHDYPLATCSVKKFKQMLVTIGEDNFKSFMKLIEADGLAHKLSKSTGFAIDGLSEIKYRYNEYAYKSPLRIKDLAINGNDIKADGFLQGEEIGHCLNWMLNIVLAHPEYNTREKLLELLELFKEMSFQNS